MGIENKIQLAKILSIGLKDFGDVNEIKFKILTSFISKNFKED